MKKALEALSDAYNLSYDSAMKNTQANVDNFNTTKTEISNLESEAKQYKDTLSSLSDKYEVDLSGIESIDEMITKLRQSGKLELTDEAELAKIDSQNAALERQLAIKEKLLLSQQKQAASDARDALGRGEQSVAQQVAQFVPGGKKRYQGQVNNVGVVEAVNENVLAIQEYENAIEKAEKAMKDLDPDSKAWKEQEENINSYNEAIEKLTEDLNTKETDLTTLLSAFSVDGEGLVALDGFEKEFKSVKDAVENLNNINLSPAEQKLAKIESFFDGSSGRNAIKEKLLDSSSSTRELEEELSRLGLTLDDIGIGNIGFLYDYLKDIKEAAKEATDSVQDYSSSVSDIEAASESADQDKNWSTISEAYKEAKELLKEGKTGTDNFQSMASFLNSAKVKELAEEGGKYTADAYQKAFEEVKKTANRWFGEDETKSMENFVNDFKKKGLFDVKTDEDGLWDIETNFKTTAEAAEKFEISIEAVETMLKSLGAYGYEFEGITFSGDALSEYESYLENIRTIYDSLDNSDLKNRLGKIIEEADLADFENHIEDLSPEIIADIKFEYDLAQIDQEIQKLKDAASGEGFTNTTSNAGLIASNESRSSKWREENSKAKKDSGYVGLDKTIGSLEDSMVGKSGEELSSIQRQIIAVQELRTAFENAYDAAEANGKELNWDDYINSTEANDALASISEKLGVTEDELEGIFGKDFTLSITSDVNMNNVRHLREEIANLERNSSITFEASVDGVDTVVEAVRDIHGNVKYYADVDGVTTELSAVENIDGTVSYVPVTDLVDKHDYDQDGVVDYKGIFPTSAPNLTATVKYSYSYAHDGSLPSENIKLAGATGTFLSPAHKDGTAYNVLNTLPISVYAGGKVGLSKNEQALVNEVGVESIVRDGVWRLLPGGPHLENLKQGDIIFNADQTRDLLRHGKTSTHARAYAQGNVLSPAYRLGSSSSGSDSGSSGSSSSKKKSSSDSSSSSNDAEKFDWIERAVKNLERAIENLGKTISATWKTWTDRNDAITDSIKKTNEEITLQKKAANRYLKEANSVGLSSTYKKKVQNGTIDIQSIKSEDTREKIKEYQEYYDKYLECLDVVADLEDDRAAKAKERFENVAAEYEAKLSVTEHEIDMLEGAIDNLEAKGYVVTEDYYNNLIAKEKENKETLEEEQKAFTTALATAMEDGKIAKYSEDWYSMMDSINEVEKAIQDADISLAEYQNDIWELDWSNFERLQDEIAKVREESDFLIGLMSDEEMYDSETGKITDEGLATMGLHAVNYDIYKSQIADYAEKIKELNGLIEDDPTNTILLEQRDEFIEQQREMVEGMKDEEQAVKDLAEQGYDALLEVLEESIEKRKKALDDTKALYDYEKSISEQTKNISSLEKQLEIAKKDTSESGRLNAQKLQNELDSAKAELAESEYDKFIDDQEKLYDNLMSDAEEFFDNRLKNTELILEEAVAATNEGAATIRQTLEDMAKGLGITLSDEMKDILTTTEQVSDIVEGNSETADENVTTTENTLANIEHKIDVINGTVEEEIGTNSGSSGSSGTSTSTPDTSTTTKEESVSNNSSKWGSWFITKKFTGNKSKLNKDTSIVDRLKWLGYDSSFSARAKYYNAMGLGSVSSYKGTAKQNAAMIKKMRDNGFNQGGTIGNLIKRTGEDGFVLAKSGETIITPETVAKLTEALQLAQPILDYTPTISNLSPISRNINTTIDIGDIIMNGVNDPKEFAVSLKYALQHNNDIKNIIQADTLGIMLGKNSLTKFKY